MFKVQVYFILHFFFSQFYNLRDNRNFDFANSVRAGRTWYKTYYAGQARNSNIDDIEADRTVRCTAKTRTGARRSKQKQQNPSPVHGRSTDISYPIHPCSVHLHRSQLDDVINEPDTEKTRSSPVVGEPRAKKCKKKSDHLDIISAEPVSDRNCVSQRAVQQSCVTTDSSTTEFVASTAVTFPTTSKNTRASIRRESRTGDSRLKPTSGRPDTVYRIPTNSEVTDLSVLAALRDDPQTVINQVMGDPAFRDLLLKAAMAISKKN